ncbi:MAG: PilZ domain-containing protein [Zetaproteobacteria bacterium CG1_02_53_45]|nr:MAG: PilZ domain-containing protein [Zetaproteobacteria bacterium CG1_02_53_45]
MFNPNHRKFSRSQVAVAALLTLKERNPVEVMVVDISMNGALLQTDLKLTPGTHCNVSILLGHFQHELPIEVTGVVVRSLEDGLALRFESVKIDSTPRLKSLIVEHAEDPEQVEVEYSQNGGWIFNPSH